MIPYGRQDIEREDMDAVMDVLASDMITQGPVVPRFEASVANAVGAAHGIAMSSATAALHVACRALELGPGDLLWTSPITFVASANAGRYCGADVDFVDIDPDTFNMCPDALEVKLEKARMDGRLPQALIPVHMAGQSCRMERIGELARTFGVRVIEDASHAIGGTYQGQPVGCGAHSDITVFSFHPVKIVTTGEGGVAVTNDKDLAARMVLLRSHGVTRNPALMTQEADGPWYYQQLELGFNYRLTDIQAALGLSQMARLADYIDRRHAIAKRYDDALDGMPLKTPGRLPDARSAFHLYVIRLDDETRHRSVFEGLRMRGIGVNLHYIPVHMQPYYAALGFSPGDFPKAEDYYRRAMSIPMFPRLTDAEQDSVIAALRDELGA